MIEISPQPLLAEEWVSDTVFWLWGFRLQRFQMEILMDLLQGGMYSVMLPTDHGKSTLIEMAVVLGVILDPQRSNIVIKVSDIAARDAMGVVCRQLQKACLHYPAVRPKVRWNHATETPMAGSGFYVEGGNFTDRNPTVYASALGSRDLQGRRGRTFLDDIETMNEAVYPAYRRNLELRVSATLRTLEPRHDALWAMFGTPYHETSIYFTIIEKLKALGPRYKMIRKPVFDPDTGVPLWRERLEKIEVHRRTMLPSEWQVAYELRPLSYGKLDGAAIEGMYHGAWPFCSNQAAMVAWLGKKYKERVASARWLIGYDPSSLGDFAVVALVTCDQHWFLVDALRKPGDMFDQLRVISDFHARFPNALVVVEKNGQQDIVIDILREHIPDAHLVKHLTTNVMSGKGADQYGIPTLLDLVRSGRFHVPGDERGRAMAYPVDQEMRQWPSGHPHLLPAIWFCTYFDSRHVVIETTQQAVRKPTRPSYTEVPVYIQDRLNRAWRQPW